MPKRKNLLEGRDGTQMKKGMKDEEVEKRKNHTGGRVFRCESLFGFDW